MLILLPEHFLKFNGAPFLFPRRTGTVTDLAGLLTHPLPWRLPVTA